MISATMDNNGQVSSNCVAKRLNLTSKQMSSKREQTKNFTRAHSSQLTIRSRAVKLAQKINKLKVPRGLTQMSPKSEQTKKFTRAHSSELTIGAVLIN